MKPKTIAFIVCTLAFSSIFAQKANKNKVLAGAKWTGVTECKIPANIIHTESNKAKTPDFCRTRTYQGTIKIGTLENCGCAYSEYGYSTNSKYFDVLTAEGEYKWEPLKKDCVLPKNVVALDASSGTKVICRGKQDTAMVVGYVSKCNCVTPSGNEEIILESPQVLTITQLPSVNSIVEKYDEILPVYRDTTLNLSSKDGYYFGFLHNGKETLPCEYKINEIPFDGGAYFKQNSKIVAGKDNYWVIVDPMGKQYLPFNAEFACDVKEEDFYVQKNGKIFVFNAEMKITDSLNYKYLHGSFYGNGYNVVVSNDGINFKYIEAKSKSELASTEIGEDYLTINVNGKYGIYKASKKDFVISPEYDRLAYYDGSFHMFKGKNKTSVSGNELRKK